MQVNAPMTQMWNRAGAAVWTRQGGAAQAVPIPSNPLTL